MVLSNEELFRIRDSIVDKYRDCRLHLANAETSLDEMIRRRQDVIMNFNNTMVSINHEIDKVKDSKQRLYTCQNELEEQIRRLNQLIAERRLE